MESGALLESIRDDHMRTQIYFALLQTAQWSSLV